MTPETLTLDEAARMLRIHRSRFSPELRQTMRGYRVGRRWFFTPEGIRQGQAELAARATPTAPAPSDGLPADVRARLKRRLRTAS